MERVTVSAARVVGGKVEILQGGEFHPADDVIIVGVGDGDSEGVVLIGRFATRYFTNTQLDTQFILERLITLVEQVTTMTTTTYCTAATAAVFSIKPEFVPITTELQAITAELTGLKLR